MAAFEEEVSLRSSLHISLDSAYMGVLAPGDRRAVSASKRLYEYSGGWNKQIEVWRLRYALAWKIQLGHLPLWALMSGIADPLFCRGSKAVQRVGAWVVGSLVHQRIMERYVKAFPNDEIVLDGRIQAHGLTPSEPLSERALRQPLTVFGALNYCLAGGRCDIINITKGHIWEIKPGGLAAKAVGQIWGYIDNFEVARQMLRYDGQPQPHPLIAGPTPVKEALPDSVLEEFHLELGAVTLLIRPYTVPGLDGLILYGAALKLPRSQGQSEALAEAKALPIKLEQILAGAATLSNLRQQESDRRIIEEILIICGITAGVLLAAVGWAAVAAGEGVVAVAGSGGLAAASATEAAGGTITELFSRTASGVVMNTALREVAAEMSKIAAGVIAVKIGGRVVEGLIPEHVGLAVDAGTLMGANARGLPKQY